MTPEKRKAQSERMKQRRQDPAFEAARLSGLSAAWKRNAETGEIGAKIAQANKAQWQDPVIRRRRLAAINKGLDEGVREMRAALLEKRRKDPEAEAYRIERLRKKIAEQKVKRRAVALANARKRRGFDVPARLWDDYRHLLDRKKLTAREAAIALGIIRAAT